MKTRTILKVGTLIRGVRGRLGATSLPLAIATFVTLVGGCMHPGPYDAARVGPFFTPTNFQRETSTVGIRRVVVLPVWVGGTTPTESAAALDEVFLTALQHQNRFEVVSLSREDCRRQFRTEALSSSSALPHDLLSKLRRDFAADAVLFIDLTVFQAYKPLKLGLRAKLATIDGSRLVWTFDNLFSADEPAVANSARRHFLNHDKSVPADLTAGVLQSPSRFAAYAATAMFATLPPVTPPVLLKETK
jgi:hypothetical protein